MDLETDTENSFNCGIRVADKTGMSSALVVLASAASTVAVAAVGFVTGRKTATAGTNVSLSASGTAGPGAPMGDPGIAALADASRQQANAMVQVAQLSAESLRAASGTYVFTLRDRFDERLPPTQLGVASTVWQALGEAPAALEFLVLHPGDVVRFTLSLVCNQVATDRRLSVEYLEVDPKLQARDPRFQASVARSGEGGQFVCPSDVSVFIEFSWDIDVAAFAVGERFSLESKLAVEAADTRPEGAIARTTVDVLITGTVLPDDDGVGLDLLAIEANIGDEARSYYLDKAERLALSLPGT